LKPKIGLVGTGQTVGIAHYHLLGINADGRAKISAVYDINKEGAAAFMAQHGIEDAVLCESYEQLLSLVDAVDICTPNFTHIDYVLGAIKADKAFFVEKPLALTASESRLALKALQGKNLFNMVGFVYRYANVMQELKKIICNEIGRVYTYSASFGGTRLANPEIAVEWRMIRKLSGSGALGDFGSHLIDNAHFTAGLTFNSVSCLSSTVIPIRPANRDGKTMVENDDQSVFIAKTAGNALASFTVSRVGMDEIAAVIVGDGGLARVSLSDPNKIVFLPSINGVYSKDKKFIDVPPQTPFEGWFVGEMASFIDGLLGIETQVADIHQGHYVEAVIEAAEKSMEAGITRIEL